jgi:hypothetical protein
MAVDVVATLPKKLSEIQVPLAALIFGNGLLRYCWSGNGLDGNAAPNARSMCCFTKCNLVVCECQSSTPDTNMTTQKGGLWAIVGT